MAGRSCRLTVAAAREHVWNRCFTSFATGSVGLECEWHVFSDADPLAPVDLAHLKSRLDPCGSLPGGSHITYEPGGQVELSSPPHAGVDSACRAMAADRDVVARVLAADGCSLVAAGVDPIRQPHRQLRAPRYDAMEAYFDVGGPAGRWMMSRTSSVQVNLDNGLDDIDADRRWRLAQQLGPTLIAAFANSPLAGGRPTGWCSTRSAVWWAIDPSRTRPVGARGGRAAWLDYALRARVMFIRTSPAAYAPITEPLRFIDWINHGHELGFPSLDDLDYHLTTLFPPVRPKGWLEIRYLDALPDPWWKVAAAVTTMLLDDQVASATAERDTVAGSGLWYEAGRDGLAHPTLARSARACFVAAIEAMERTGVDPALVEASACYLDRFVARGRCPADDIIETRRGLVPAPVSASALFGPGRIEAVA
jgi:glutamate--cysteine ligase